MIKKMIKTSIKRKRKLFFLKKEKKKRKERERDAYLDHSGFVGILDATKSSVHDAKVLLKIIFDHKVVSTGILLDNTKIFRITGTS